MPMVDVIRPDGKEDEVFVHRLSDLKEMGLKRVYRLHKPSLSGSARPETTADQMKKAYRSLELRGIKSSFSAKEIKRIWGMT